VQYRVALLRHPRRYRTTPSAQLSGRCGEQRSAALAGAQSSILLRAMEKFPLNPKGKRGWEELIGVSLSTGKFKSGASNVSPAFPVFDHPPWFIKGRYNGVHTVLMAYCAAS